MKLKSIFAAGLMAGSVMTQAAFAADSFSADQKKEMEQVIHNYLVTNPEVLIEASQALQTKQRQDMENQAKSAIQSNAKDLFSGDMTVMGNPKGNVTLVEFFDYQCVHCKKMAPVIEKLVKDNNNVRVIFREFPIFGKSSDLASRAALAAALQGKYKEMHTALLKQDQRLNEKLIMDTAKSIGLNVDKLKKDMDSEKVVAELKQTRMLADKLHLMGTPAFIIAGTPNGQFSMEAETSFVPGAASQEALQDMINKAAKKS